MPRIFFDSEDFYNSKNFLVSNVPADGLRSFNILRPRQNGRHFPDDIFTCIFLNENVRISIKI